jgi:hypothetical protein
MKSKNLKWIVLVSAGFTGWRIFERGRLSSRFVATGLVDPGDASIASGQLIPFWSTVTYKDLTNTIETSAAPGQIENTYAEFAADAWLIAQS